MPLLLAEQGHDLLMIRFSHLEVALLVMVVMVLLMMVVHGFATDGGATG